MAHFAVALIYFQYVSASKDPTFAEESIIFVEALDEVEAKSKALEFVDPPLKISTEGLSKEWRFYDVASVFEIEAERIAHGAELFSRFLRVSEAESLLTRFEEEHLK